MSWHDIDAGRHRWLLRQALPNAELKEFFKDNFRRLLANREKLRNTPATEDVAVNAVLRFQEGGRHIFAEWLQKRFEPLTAEEASQIATKIRARETGDDDGEDVIEMAQIGLQALYSDDPPLDWLALLKTPMRGQETDEPADAPASSIAEMVLSDDALESFFKRLFDEPPSAGASTLLDPVAAALAGIPMASRFWSNSLEFDRAVFPRTASYLDATLERRAAVREVGTAAKPLEVERELEDMDLLAGDVIAQCTRIIPRGPAFLDVVGFAIPGRAFTIPPGDFANAVPTEGKLILHPDAGIPMPQLGQLRSYRVEEMNTSNPIKVKAVELGDALFRVEHLPFQANDPDSIRETIKSWAANPSYYKVLFVTQDGLCIKPKSVERLTMDSAFDEPFDAWPTLPSVMIGQSEFIVAPLPAPTSHYDCSTLTMMTRRMLRRAVEHKVAINKSQIQALLEQLPEIELNEQRRARFARAITAIESQAAQNQEVIEQLLGLPKIAAEIERRKQTIIEESSKEARDQTAQLADLCKQRATVESALEELEGQKREMVKSTRAAVRKAFDGARKQELEAVEKFAILPAFYSEARAALPDAISSLSRRNLPKATVDLAAALVEFGILEATAVAFMEALSLAVDWGLPIVIEGGGASTIARRVAQFVAKAGCIEIDVPIGLVASKEFDEIVSTAADADVLLLHSANLSDLGCYAAAHLDNVVQSAFRAKAELPKRLIMSGSSGVAGLPWPREVQDIGLKFNLDIANDMQHLNDAAASIGTDEEAQRRLPPMRRRLIRKLAGKSEEGSGNILYLAFFAKPT
jgi:hypothetical protein